MTDGKTDDGAGAEFDLRGLDAVRVVLGGVTRQTVIRWEDHGLKLYRLNGRIYAKRKEVLAWMAGRVD